MTYENLLAEADNEKLIVKEKDIDGYSGRIYKTELQFTIKSRHPLKRLVSSLKNLGTITLQQGIFSTSRELRTENKNTMRGFGHITSKSG